MIFPTVLDWVHANVLNLSWIADLSHVILAMAPDWVHAKVSHSPSMPSRHPVRNI